MSMISYSDEEDNNPFVGSNHMYASGIANVARASGNAGLKSGVRSDDLEEEVEEEVGDSAESIGSGIRALSDGSDNIEERLGLDKGGTSNKIEAESPQTNLTKSSHFEPYVSLSMSMINTPNDGESNTAIKVLSAGDYKDPWGKHAIGYDVEFEGKRVIRRYSEFNSLREALTKLLPSIVIPSIPGKHSLVKYFLNPINVESDKRTIGKRKRMLQIFLNHCYSIPELRNHIVFQKFTSPDYMWKDVLTSPPITVIPANNLLAPPLNPTKPSPMHLLLPSPSSVSKVELMKLQLNEEELELEKQFAAFEDHFGKCKLYLRTLHKCISHDKKQFKSLSKVLAELGAYFNSLSLENSVIQSNSVSLKSKMLSDSIESVGHSFDVSYVNSQILLESMMAYLDEPIEHMLGLVDDCERVLYFRDLKRTQYQIVQENINKKEARIKALQDTQAQLKRLGDALTRNAKESTTIADALKSNRLPVSVDSSWDQISMSSDNTDLKPNSSTVNKDKKKYRNSITTSKAEPHLLSEEERQDEIEKLNKELSKLKDCFKLIGKDMQEINESSLSSLKNLSNYFEFTWLLILKSFSRAIIKWAKESLKAWHMVRTIHENQKK